MLAGLGVYFLNFLAGKTKNGKLAQTWFTSHKSLLEENFSIVGMSPQSVLGLAHWFVCRCSVWHHRDPSSPVENRASSAPVDMISLVVLTCSHPVSASSAL